jgi:hypothetical protein
MIGFPIGIVYANAVEWVVHKYVLHGLGKRKNSMFGFHWKNHHRNARRFAMVDPEYKKPIWDWESRGREVAGIAVIMAVHLPMVAVAPWFTAAVVYASVNYLHKHKKCHTDVEWGRRHMRHHYDHHMGKDQDTNWCVTRPWFDYVMGTRVEFEDPLARTEASPLPSVEAPVVAPAREVATPAPNLGSAHDARDDEREVVARPEPEETSGVLERDAAFEARSPLDWAGADDAGTRPSDEEESPESLPVPSTPPKAA